MLWLVFCGSIIGYSAYVYALDRLPIALVSVYTYVNPIVAAILGSLTFNEPFGKREVLAMVVIFAGVGVVKATTPSQAPSRRVLHQSSAEQ